MGEEREGREERANRYTRARGVEVMLKSGGRVRYPFERRGEEGRRYNALFSKRTCSARVQERLKR